MSGLTTEWAAEPQLSLFQNTLIHIHFSLRSIDCSCLIVFYKRPAPQTQHNSVNLGNTLDQQSHFVFIPKLRGTWNQRNIRQNSCGSDLHWGSSFPHPAHLVDAQALGAVVFVDTDKVLGATTRRGSSLLDVVTDLSVDQVFSLLEYSCTLWSACTAR